MRTFLGEVLDSLMAHPGVAAAAIAAIIVVMLVRAVINSSYRYR